MELQTHATAIRNSADIQPPGELRPRPTGLHAGAPLSRVSPVVACYQLVAAEMEEAEGHLGDLLQSTVPAVPAIGGYLAAAGGKRLRPLLTALGARAAGSEGEISRLMCVGELLHLGSLLHDDVVDDAWERRGRPAAQRVYGNPAVILTGDFCLARAVWLASDEGGHRAVGELGHTVTRMAEGEVLQLLSAGSLDPGPDGLKRYLEVVEKKSAALISWCAAAGAWAIGADEHAAALYAYGHQVGVAFQLTDDVLDYVGDRGVTGKRRGRDLAEGKLTLPLVLAMQRSPELCARLAKGTPSPERVVALLEEVRATGATDDALQMARERVAIGIAALESLPPSPWRDALTALAWHLVDRVS